MSRRRGRESDEDSERGSRRTRSHRERSESVEPEQFHSPPGGFMYPLDENHPYMGRPFQGPASRQRGQIYSRSQPRQEPEEFVDDNLSGEQGYATSSPIKPAATIPLAETTQLEHHTTRSQAHEFVPRPPVRARKGLTTSAPAQVAAPPSPDILPNPLNDPETSRLNERLKALRRQDRELERLCEPAAGGAGCSKGDVEVEWTQNRQEIEALAQSIQSAWANAIRSGSVDETPIVSLVDGYKEAVEVERAMREGRRTNQKEAAKRAEQYSAILRGAVTQVQSFGMDQLKAIFRDISTIGADILMSMILLAVLSTSETQDAIINRMLGSGTLSTLYNLISTFIVRPFVNHNLDTIRELPALVQQGCSISTLQQMHALLGLVVTGATAYGVTHIGARTTPVRSILASIPSLQEFLESSRTAITGTCSHSINLVSVFIQDIRMNLLGRNPSVAAPSSRASMTSTSTYGSASSRQIGSVVVSIFGDEESVAPIIRHAFQELVRPSVPTADSQLSELTQSQPIFEKEDDKDEDNVGGKKRKSRSKQKRTKRTRHKRKR